MISRTERYKIERDWFRSMVHDMALMHEFEFERENNNTDLTNEIMWLKEVHDFLVSLRDMDKEERIDEITEGFPEALNVIGLDEKGGFRNAISTYLLEEYPVAESDDLLEAHIRAIRSILIDLVGCGYLDADKEDLAKEILEGIPEPYDSF